MTQKSKEAGSGPAATKIESRDERSREIFRGIVESYLETGEPVGSRTLARALPLSLSPASIRNIMADLEHMGLLTAPHTSAGRLPSHFGLRMFVDGLLEVGDLTEREREAIEGQLAGSHRNIEDVLTGAAAALSGPSHCVAYARNEWGSGSLHVNSFAPSWGPGRSIAVNVFFFDNNFFLFNTKTNTHKKK